LTDFFIVSCEHGGKQIPQAYQRFFQTDDDQALLNTHRGFDAGALLMAQDLAERLAAPLVSSTVSRLLVDLNRSLGHPKLHSNPIRNAPASLRAQIIKQHYLPYRTTMEELVQQGVEQGKRVVHISCHSFTPELNGIVRTCDVGLLYDPARQGEAKLCKTWQLAIHTAAPYIKVRRNYPYAGKNDGLTTALRRRYSADEYIGIELEINQKHILKPDSHWVALRIMLIESLLGVLGVMTKAHRMR
jgi:predicted N-formylglutamate amidohydrolase